MKKWSKNVGVAVLGGFNALEWALQTFFFCKSIEIYFRICKLNLNILDS